MRQLIVSILRFYQRYLSALMPASCRFYPSCSHYAADAVHRHGVRQGLRLGLRRIGKCHPFHPGGVDPVPDNLEGRQ